MSLLGSCSAHLAGCGTLLQALEAVEAVHLDAAASSCQQPAAHRINDELCHLLWTAAAWVQQGFSMGAAGCSRAQYGLNLRTWCTAATA